MTDNAHVFIEARKPITLTMPEKVELAAWIKEQAASQLTYSQLADYAHADLGFLVTPSHVENMWRTINGRRKAEAKQDPTPAIPVAQGQVLDGMITVLKSDMDDLCHRLSVAEDTSINVCHNVIPEGMAFISNAELGDLREALADALAASFMQSQRAEMAEAVYENYRRQAEIHRDSYDGLISELKNTINCFEVTQ